MAGTKYVRIVGNDDVWEVLCETDATMVLVNPAARDRRDIAALERQLEEARQRLETRKHAAAADVLGNEITGP